MSFSAKTNSNIPDNLRQINIANTNFLIVFLAILFTPKDDIHRDLLVGIVSKVL
jgi:hypothetical protein